MESNELRRAQALFIGKKIKEIDYSANVYGFDENLEILKKANSKGLVSTELLKVSPNHFFPDFRIFCSSSS